MINFLPGIAMHVEPPEQAVGQQIWPFGQGTLHTVQMPTLPGGTSAHRSSKPKINTKIKT